jgi:hypothetical protein
VAAEVLEEHRHAAEGPVGQVAGRVRPSLLEPVAHDGVEPRPHPLDAGDRVLDELDRTGPPLRTSSAQAVASSHVVSVTPGP